MFPDPVPPSTPLPPLMPLDTVKGLLGVPLDNVTLDSQITFAMNVVSALIRGYTGRSLTKGNYTDQFHPPQTWAGPRGEAEGGRAFLSLTEYPVQSIGEVKVNGVVQTALTYRAHRAIGVMWPNGIPIPAELEITYLGGFDPIPFDLQGVFLALVRKQLTGMGVDLSTAGAPVPSVAPIKSVTVGALKVDYNVAQADNSSSGGGAVTSEALEEYADVLDGYLHSRRLAATAA